MGCRDLIYQMPLPVESAAIERTLMRETAYERLRDLIVTGTLEPGEALRDKAIAAWLGVSRMPVREALARLAADGLVVVAANRFTRVAQLDSGAAAEAHRLSGLLEGEMAAELSVRHDAALIGVLERLAEKFRWALWRGDRAEAIAADEAFHAVLRGDADPLIGALSGRVDALARRAQHASWPALAGAWPEEAHAQLTAAMTGLDAETARRAVAGEWQRLARTVEGALAPG